MIAATGKKPAVSGWWWVLLGGLFEIGFTFALKKEQHDSNYGSMFLICAILSFECLSLALKTLPLSIAYAIWTGIGSVGAVALGIFVFHEPLSALRGVVLALLILSLIGLKLLTPDKGSEA